MLTPALLSLRQSRFLLAGCLHRVSYQPRRDE
jgi:hypothetical protein